jgi:hypothetical protein
MDQLNGSWSFCGLSTKPAIVTGLGFGGSLSMDKNADQEYEPEVAQQRFEKLVKAALNTPPKPLKSMTPKGVPAQFKKRRKKAKSAA